MNTLEAAAPIQPTTRCGYKPNESLHSFETCLSDSGAVATGKSLHFSADVLCSGGYDIWVKTIWDYVIHHVGIASPRIFVYLRKRFKELDELFKRFPDEQLYHTDEFHTRCGEIIMVLREVPRRPKLVWPKVGPETHLGGWLRTVSGAAETAVIKRVWKGEGDMMLLRVGGCEILQAIADGSTEKTLFWIRWFFEEETAAKKQNKGASLSTIARGPDGSHDVGHYIAALFVEAYKDLAARQLIRMNEELAVLVDLWRGGDARISPSGRRHILGLLGQILCEIPRWKVPAAPALIKDPVQVSRAVGQSGKFFREVLANPAVKNEKEIIKLFRSKGLAAKREKKKDEQTMSFEQKMTAYDSAMDDWLSSK
jgi:hypothetical protein